jgi:cytosine/adenosine deaminase-related metal-dependent hydrolase
VSYDVLLRDAYTVEHDAVVDIGVEDGEIRDVAADGLDADADRVIDAGGNLVSPGLVDPHKHVDRALVADGERVPRGNEAAFDMERSLEHERAYYADATVDDVAETAARNLEMAVAHGTTHVRSHLTVDSDLRGTDCVEAAVRARELADDVVDLQLVPGSYEDTTTAGRRALEEAIELADDDDRHKPVLLGGSEPAIRTGDLDGTLDLWFDVAERHDVDVDVHVDEEGTLGGYTLERLADRTEERGYEGRVTAVHAYGLAAMPLARAREVIDRCAEVDMGLIACYNSVRAGMPMQDLLTGDVAFAHGTDNDRDFVLPHGNANQVEAANVLVHKLHGARERHDPDGDYRWLESNPGLGQLWDAVTYAGAEILGLEGYGVREGTPADLAVFEAASPQWAVVDAEDPTHVLKDGRVVAEDGAVLPEFSPV